MEVADAIAQNNTILRLNLHFDTLGPRIRVTEKLKQNLDACKSPKYKEKRTRLHSFNFFLISVRKKRLSAKQETKN